MRNGPGDRVDLVTDVAGPQWWQSLFEFADAIPIGIAYVDRGLRYRFSNAAYEKRCGHSRSDLRHRRMNEVLDGAAYAQSRPHTERALAGHEVSFDWHLRPPKLITRCG